ncbi:hypothetical protein HPB48_018506 [Haemaphysalis longicornis]|uniref:Protein kinase domain-containing protein n=1 Tax=Haemaphysalis longicornis TaxID=44386 RepID=A0A9J6GN91_HAELO|nr:hypothetical protein HPB48_018506 [Haemaphysalis longicornis]
MGSTDDEDPDEAEKSKQSLEAHGYEVGKTLGAGSYSTVKLVVKDGATYACKIISKEKSCEIYRVKFLPRELKILGATKHPHITRVFKIIEEPVKVFIIMEMACGGDLLEKILRVKRLDEKTSHQFFMQLASALGYLHKHDIAHRDLKCENVLLTTVDVVKLTDFSFARYCSDRNKQKELSETYCGSTAYAAPEVLQGVRYKPLHADVWGLGVILYVMVTGLLPHERHATIGKKRVDAPSSQLTAPNPSSGEETLPRLDASSLDASGSAAEHQNGSSEEESLDDEDKRTVEVQTDRCEAPPSGSGDTERIRLLEAQVKHLQGKVQSLKQARSVRVMDDDKVHFYTGLSKPLFFAILDSIAPVLPKAKRVFPHETQLLSFLMKLRLNLPFKDLAYRFGVTRKTISRSFRMVLQAVHHLCKGLIVFSSPEICRSWLTEKEKKNFPHLRTIIDCTEVRLARHVFSHLDVLYTWHQAY